MKKTLLLAVLPRGLRVTRPALVGIAFLLAIFLAQRGYDSQEAYAVVTPLTNTSVSEAQVSALPGMTAVPALEGYSITVLDAQGDPGNIHSIAYGLGGGLFLYGYQVECHTGPNWDIPAIVVPMSGNSPVAVDFDGVGPPDDSFSVTTPTFAFQPYTLDLVAFNANDLFSVDAAGDNPFLVEFDDVADNITFNIPDVFLTSGVFGFVTDSPPQIVNGTFATGSTTAFDIVAPGGPPVVGGIVEFLAGGDSPAEGSASSSSDYTLPIAAVAAGAVLALAVGGWYARRRWLR